MPNNTKKEECHCQRTDRLHRVDSNFKNHTFERCWKDKNKEEDRTKAFGMNNGGSHVNYTGSLLREEKCICGRKKHEWTCKPYVDSVVSPSSNEDWEIEFDKFAESQVISFGTRQETKYLTDIWATAYKELKDFIRTTRLEAQRELTEEIINYMEDGLDEPTDWYVSVKNFLSSRGLLPKITE